MATTVPGPLKDTTTTGRLQRLLSGISESSEECQQVTTLQLPAQDDIASRVKHSEPEKWTSRARSARIARDSRCRSGAGHRALRICAGTVGKSILTGAPGPDYELLRPRLALVQTPRERSVRSFTFRRFDCSDRNPRIRKVHSAETAWNF
jgi:hypothetical protein